VRAVCVCGRLRYGAADNEVRGSASASYEGRCRDRRDCVVDYVVRLAKPRAGWLEEDRQERNSLPGKVVLPGLINDPDVPKACCARLNFPSK
jgi:hypothetical protein